MSATGESKRGYFPQNQFSLDRDFLQNPLMAGVKLARYKFVAKMLSSDDVVLDLGCGNGYSTHFFSTFAKSVIGVDLYADMEAARVTFPGDNIEFVKADILDPPDSITSRRFSAITSIDVIEHFYREDGEKIVETYAELLADNGMMIIGSPSKFSEQYRSKQSQDVHFYEYEPDEIKELCDRFFGRTILFSMNDEIVHTGFYKLAWFVFVLCFK